MPFDLDSRGGPFMPSDMLFDDRHDAADDGADFERFIYEIFDDGLPGGALKPGRGRGRDGAIDLLHDAEGARTIVECKFIGRHATDEPLRRWKQVRNHLADNLPQLADKPPDERGSSLYAPWLDQEKPIIGYRFCVTRPLAHGDREILQKAILADFAALARSRGPMAHLASIAVEIEDWGLLRAKLQSNFPLILRWFGNLQIGRAHV